MRREQLGAVPSTLTTDRWPLTTTCEPASAGSGGATSRARVGARPPKTSGKPLVSTVSRSAFGERLGLLRHHRVDAVEQRAVADRGGQPGQRRRAERHGDQPGDQQHGEQRDERAADVVAPAAPARLRDRVPQVGAEPAGEGLPEHRQRRRSATSETTTRTCRPSNCSASSGPSCRPDQRAAEEAGEREHADDETLPVAADREHQHEQDQDEIDGGHPFRVRGRCQLGHDRPTAGWWTGSTR